MMDRECQDLTDRLSAYLDGELQGQDLDEIVRHLEECGCCRHCLAEIRLVRDALHRIEPPDLPPGLKERLKSCLHEARKK